jgi:crotonobetaine/carnitine-CoA ligase
MESRAAVVHLIAERAARSGHRVLVEEVDGEVLTYGDLHERSLRWASVLAGLGVGAGDAVCSTVAGATVYWTWLGAGWLEAVHVPVNPDLPGNLLVAALVTAGSAVVVVERAQLDGVLAVADRVPQLRHVVVIDAESVPATAVAGIRVWSAKERLVSADASPRPLPAASTVHCGIFTSGTTGPSKCALRTWSSLDASARWLFPTDPESRWPDGAYYTPWPAFHGLGLSALGVAVHRDMRVVVRRGFSLSRFWEDVRRYRCTHALWLVVAPLIMGREPRPDDAANPLRHLTVVPLVRDVHGLAARFGVEVATMYGQSETGPVLVAAHPLDHRASGRPVPYMEVRVVDASGEPVDPGQTGELIVRSKCPGQIADVYLGMPDAMADKWRNGWFHTGDVFRIDGHGRYQFVDRLKDSIRHRGHNISSIELEREVLAHPAVAECACVGVPSELADGEVFGDQDVKAVVVARPGAAIVPRDLVEFVASRVPKFMVPRYIEVRDELPKTPTMKVRKDQLRDTQPGLLVWDRHSEP